MNKEKQFVVNMNIPRSVSGIFINRNIFNKLQTHLTGKLLNIGVLSETAHKFFGFLFVLLYS